METLDVDVVVVGGGPTGLMLAAEVGRAGRSVIVLEKRAGLSTLSRAFGVHARTLELLDQRGLAEQLVSTGVAAPGLRLLGSAEIDLSRLESPFNFILVTPQYNVERAIEAYALARGARLVRRADVAEIEQDADGVSVRALTPEGELIVHGRFVVGADGVRSHIRSTLGIPFPGEELLNSIMLVDVELRDPPPDVVTVNAVEDCFAFVAPFGDGVFRVICWDRLNQAPPGAAFAADDVRSVLRRALGTDFGMAEPSWMSRFSCDERQVSQYRHARVLLAGDAAHMHSPAAGQGMNTGIQDAINLGWKLAAVLDGAEGSVLDTYDAERHPVGAQVLKTSGAMIRLMLVQSRLRRTVRDALLARMLRIRPVAVKVALMFSGVGIGYERRPDQHHLVGTRAADIKLVGDERLFAAMRDGGFVLVIEPDSSEETPHRGLRVVRRQHSGPGLLIRPDGYVAWAGDTASGTWRTALHEWVGPVRADAEPALTG